jgi:hypothetical protein
MLSGIDGFSLGQFSFGEPHEKLIQICAARGDYGPGAVETLVAERMELSLPASKALLLYTRAPTDVWWKCAVVRFLAAAR